jgi:hypothetical protein
MYEQERGGLRERKLSRAFYFIFWINLCVFLRWRDGERKEMGERLRE